MGGYEKKVIITMRVSVHIPDALGAEAKRYAKKEGLSVSQFYAQAVEAALERRKRKEAHERISQLIGTVDSEEHPRHRFDKVQRDLRREDSQRS